MSAIAQAQLCRPCSSSRPAENTRAPSTLTAGPVPNGEGTFPVPDNNLGLQVQGGISAAWWGLTQPVPGTRCQGSQRVPGLLCFSPQLPGIPEGARTALLFPSGARAQG